MINLKLPLKYEFALIIVLESVILLLNITSLSEMVGVFGVLRVMTGLIGVLLLPGYLLQSALFPRVESLDTLERAALSFVLSVAIIPLLALLLDLVPSIGLSQTAMFIGEMVVIIGLSFIAWSRRRIINPDYRMQWGTRTNIGLWWQETSSIERVLYGLFGLILLIGSFSAIIMVTQSGSAELMTEFYLLDKADSAEGLPYRVTVGAPIPLIIGIVNREGRDTTYRVEITHEDTVLAQESDIAIKNGERAEIPIEFALTTSGQAQLVKFTLYRVLDETPYRTLTLFLDAPAN